MTRIKLIYWIIVMVLLITSFLLKNHPDWFRYSGLGFMLIGYFIQTVIPIRYYKKLEDGEKSNKFAEWCSKFIF